MRRSRRLDSLSPGAWIIVFGAIVSGLIFVAWPLPPKSGRDFWVFSPPNIQHYRTVLDEWNAAHPHAPINVVQLHYQALERRLVAAFTADAPVADLVETEIFSMSRAFAGPLADIGFVDLTDRLRAEGLFEQINAPSFGPWTTRGRTFGIPHDVHPCLLGYRADIVEAAGIDVNQVETWDDFRRVLGPLIQDHDGDGRADRYLLNFWHNNYDLVKALLTQASGEDYFDANGNLQIATEINARTLAELVSWIAGPRRFCVDARDFTAGGDKMRLDGTVIASILPDWQAGTWKANLPGLAGKVKLMPLPAWQRGGRRTSVSGGTCLGITKAAPDFEQSWAAAKFLYLSPRVAESLYRSTYIISPVKAHWTRPFYHEPDAYFSGQKVGALYIEQAPHVPVRTASPYMLQAMERMMGVLGALREHAIARDEFGAEPLLPEARRLLAAAQRELAARIDRNVLFHQAE